VGLVPGGVPMARLPRIIGRGRALEVLPSSEDIRGADTELFGCVNVRYRMPNWSASSMPLATRIASFDKWAIANTKGLVNEASLPPDVDMRAGWDASMASVTRPAAEEESRPSWGKGSRSLDTRKIGGPSSMGWTIGIALRTGRSVRGADAPTLRAVARAASSESGLFMTKFQRGARLFGHRLGVRLAK
jgi:hypothetical protein